MWRSVDESLLVMEATPFSAFALDFTHLVNFFFGSWKPLDPPLSGDANKNFLTKGPNSFYLASDRPIGSFTPQLCQN